MDGNSFQIDLRSKLLEGAIVNQNLQQNVIVTTEDKLENNLLKYLKNIEDRKAWSTPFGVFLTLIFIPITTEKFRDIFFISASVWEAACYLGIIASFVMTLRSSIKSYFCKDNLENLINKIKNS